MNSQYYRSFYDRIGSMNGWDFSRVKAVSEGVKWDFFNEVALRCTPTDLLLDIGTGGGERLLSIADCCLLLIGIDQSQNMIQSANANSLKSKKPNIRFLHMDAEHLEFPRRFFDVVSCRQSPFNANEIAKVLTEEGVFLTQQVSEHDKLNLVQAFGRNRTPDEDGTLLTKYVSDLTQAGFSDIQTKEYDAAEYYATYEDLLFLLKHTPTIPGFGEWDQDFDILQQFIEDHQTAQGIRTNSKRFMIIARR